jgi:UDP-glucose 4-epimerase
MESISKGEKPVIYGEGKQKRDFIYVRDTARASVLAKEKGRVGEIYNVGTGMSTDFNSIFRVVKEEMNYECDADHVNDPSRATSSSPRLTCPQLPDNLASSRNTT